VPVSPRLRDFLERWLEETVRPTLSPATTSNYDMFTRLYIVPDLGDRKLDKLMVRDVQVWVNTLRVRCQCCFQGKDAARPEPQCCALGACCHEVASDWTVHQAWRVLRGALTQAMREELIFRNVAALVRVPMPRAKKQAVWTVEEARTFLESARDDGDPMYAGYVLLLTLGLRRGEMLGLAWEDVDLRAGRGPHRLAGPEGRPLATPAPHQDTLFGCAATSAGDRGDGTRAAPGRGGQATARGRRHVGRLWPGLHDPAR
jgi:integrase